MDRLSVIGVIGAILALTVGVVLKGATIGALWNLGAFVVVFVGTTSAVLLRTPMGEVRRAISHLRWVFRPPKMQAADLIGKIVGWSEVSRRGGLLGLEPAIENESDVFVQKGLQLLVDGAEPTTIREILEVDVNTSEAADMDAARMFEYAGIYSPTMGIVGAVMGLMAVMQHLSQPSQMGEGIAAAFVSTIYGIALGYLFMLPISSKLKSIAHHRSHLSVLLVEGLVSIAQGENPHRIESRLKGFLQ